MTGCRQLQLAPAPEQSIDETEILLTLQNNIPIVNKPIDDPKAIMVSHQVPAAAPA